MPRRTKVDMLPPRLKAELERLLIDKTHGGYLALSKWLAEKGYYICAGSLNKYDMRLQAMMERVRASTEAARLIMQNFPDLADEHSAAAIRMVQSQLFDALIKIREAEANADPAERIKLLSQAARAIAEASRASITQKRWQDEVKAKLDEIERSASRDGKTLDPETLRMVREALYG